MAVVRKKDALEYHSRWRPGKIEVVPSKPCVTQQDLAYAYTPGVAEACREIQEDPDKAYIYTTKWNLIAVISDGTAVLGLGNIGPLAGKPVMEGKGVLFKRFADVDVFDIEVDEKNSDQFIKIVKAISPTFGGINLEDIKAPECFYIEEKLKEQLDIPVFHDDQHGTAIISGAGLINAVEIQKKKIGDVKVVFSGAGAAGIACAKIFMSLGVRKENITFVDTKGVIYAGRKEGMNSYKEFFARDTKMRTLADAMKGADVFCGLSQAGMVTKDMVASMAPNPIIFAMANPDPEITYEDAVSVRKDLIMATGRSDYPNQVNNVLGFPFIFRGALDVRAKAINEEMKIAAAHALATLARKEVPDEVCQAYGGQRFHFGPEYIIPKPFDHRVLLWVAPAVAKAAMDSGVARKPIADFEAYKENLEKLVNPSAIIMRRMIDLAKKTPKRIVFPEGEHVKILRAAQKLKDEKIAIPILVGRRDRIHDTIKKEEIDLEGVEIVDPLYSPKYEDYAEAYFKLRQRKGVTKVFSKVAMRNFTQFALMMVQEGDADGVVTGLTGSYPDSMKPALQIIGPKKAGSKVCGVYMVIHKKNIYFFSDTTVNINPNSAELAQIAIQTAQFVSTFGITPKVAMLSFSNFGASPCEETYKVKKAVEIVHQQAPDLIIDGEVQASSATDPVLMKDIFPFSKIQGDANVFIFPELNSANISYQLLANLGGAVVIGPILLGMGKPANILQQGTDVDSIFNLAVLTAVQAQGKM